jgi:co-chaperonin GroES (HSP10)
MKPLMLALPLAACCLANCAKDTVLEGPRTMQAAAAFSAPSAGAVKTHSVPFEGTFKTVAVDQSSSTQREQRLTGSGLVSPLGKATFEAIATVALVPGTALTLNGTATLTAANGDLLFSTFTGTSVQQSGSKRKVMVRHTITGGTGRYRGASGFLVGVLLANPATSRGLLKLAGELAY